MSYVHVSPHTPDSASSIFPFVEKNLFYPHFSLRVLADARRSEQESVHPLRLPSVVDSISVCVPSTPPLLLSSVMAQNRTDVYPAPRKACLPTFSLFSRCSFLPLALPLPPPRFTDLDLFLVFT